MKYANLYTSALDVVNTVALCGGKMSVAAARRHVRTLRREHAAIALRMQCAPCRPTGDWLTWDREARSMRQANWGKPVLQQIIAASFAK